MPNMLSVNFEGVESGGMSFVHIPEGDYAFKIVKVKQNVGKDSGQPYLLFSLKATSGNPKGVNKVIPHTCSLTKNSLWNLRNLLEAAGKQIPAKAVKIDLDRLVGLSLAGTVIDAEFDGKKKSEVTAFFPVSELSTGETKKDESTGDDSSDEATEGTESSDEEEELFG